MHDQQARPTSRNPWLLLLLGFLAAAALIAIDALTKGAGERLVREGGGVELATALLYGYAAVVWLWLHPGDEWRRFWQIPFIVMLLMGREFDLDKKLLSVGILKSHLYLTNEAAVPERIAGVVFVLFAAVTVIRLLRVNGAGFLAALRRAAPWAMSVVAAVALGVASKAIDGLGRKLAPFGITLDPWAASAAVLMEEWLELGIPLMILLAVALHAGAGRPPEGRS